VRTSLCDERLCKLAARLFWLETSGIPASCRGAVRINPNGNSVIVNGDALSVLKETINTFVMVTKQAFAACVKNEEPCLDSFFAEVSGLDCKTQYNQCQRTKELMLDKTTIIALGWFDLKRLAFGLRVGEDIYWHGPTL
jgi:NitT/TauT family transport system substrate-binding protein